MSTATARVFTGLTRAALSGRLFIHSGTTTVRLCSVRSLTLTAQMSATSKKPTDGEEEVIEEPIKFSTSKASHRTWKVENSMGSQHQQPWWKVLPVSLIGISFLLWCALREETEIDEQLEKHLFEHVPGLLPDKNEQAKEKPT